MGRPSSAEYETGLTEGTAVAVAAGEWGKGVHVPEARDKGALLWTERPLFVGQCCSYLGETCAGCMTVTDRYTGAEPMPAIPKGCEKDAALFAAPEGAPPAAVPGAHECEWYCSAACRDASYARFHRLVCSAAYRALLAEWYGRAENVKLYNQRLLALKLLCTVCIGPLPAGHAACEEQAKALAHIEALVELPYPVCGGDAAQEAKERAVFDALAAVVAAAQGGAVPEDFTFARYLTMLSKLKANAVELDLGLRLAGERPARVDAQKASALFALQAFVNHSCNPSGHRVFYNGRLHFLAVRDIAAGEQLLMAYVNPASTLKERQAKLSSHWKILCTCERCTQDTMKLVMLKQLFAGLKAKAQDRAEQPGIP
eukprot:TRINITY_DN11950_c0_g1_i1.p2 TRINITY_DN11950_c0_g1~~TRINITY_DN11950_c0_g1_i1.p2  ORF type:complete len:371 (+),score=134.80 TRINITY_DN11950_c0_g1_i1:76-1188(+)